MSESVIAGLKPETLWKRFYEISQFPRPSKKESKIVEHMKKLFTDLGVEFKEDKVGNLVAKIKATPGYENSPTVVLQGHVDMVCEKNKTTVHDFDHDPIKLKREDGWIKADGTTLGSDNGIGVAAGLAIITDKESTHGPLEVLLTIDEETGLTGANNLAPGFINGKILLNLDSEEDGAFYVGCSGGQDTVARFNLELEDMPKGLETYELLVTGLKGGHSGLDIHQNRGNAIKILARIFEALNKIKFYISSVNGGSKRNAIPREAEAIICLDKSDVDKAKKIIEEFEKKLKIEYKVADKGVNIEFKKSSSVNNKVFSNSFKEKITDTLLALPHGVVAMSQDIPDLVETSTNIATITTSKDELVIGTSQRSSIDSAKIYVVQNVSSVFKLAGAKIESGDGYPGWKPDLDSNVLKLSKNVYKELYGKEPEIKAIHAGLECGILGDKNPGLDMVSFGPTIQGAHSPDERVNIETVDKFYNLLKAILKKIAAQSKN